MTKWLRLPGISLRIEECTQCGASSGLSETLGESYANETDSGSPHLWVISVPVPVSIPVPAFPFPFPRFRAFQLPQSKPPVFRHLGHPPQETENSLAGTLLQE